MATVIATANKKGGVGKTTTTMELAYLFGKEGKRVLAIDMDPQCGLTERSPISTTRNHSIKEVLQGYIDTDDAIQKTAYYDIIPGNEDLDEDQSMYKEDNKALKDIVGYLYDDYDIILIDAPPGNSILNSMIYLAANYLIVAVDGSPDALTGIAKMTVKIKQYKEAGKTDVAFIGSLMCNVNMAFGYPSKLYRDRYVELVRDIQPIITAPPFKTYIRRSDKCGAASGYQMAINEYDDKCCSAIDYTNLIEEIRDRIYKLSGKEI